MQIDEATKQGTATRTERDERISSMAGLGAEMGTAADGKTTSPKGAGHPKAGPEHGEGCG